MKIVALLAALALSTAAFAADTKPPAAAPAADPHSGMKMPGFDPHAGVNMPAGKAAPLGNAQANLTQKATVISTISVPSYTYLEVSQNKKTLWVAAPTVTAKKGDTVQFDDGMVMNEFHSKTLKRTFPSILFVNKLVVGK